MLLFDLKLMLTNANVVLGADSRERPELFGNSSTFFCSEAHQLHWRLPKPAVHFATHAFNVASQFARAPPTTQFPALIIGRQLRTRCRPFNSPTFSVQQLVPECKCWSSKLCTWLPSRNVRSTKPPAKKQCILASVSWWADGPSILFHTGARSCRCA
jgi:hypothetical protein